MKLQNLTCCGLWLSSLVVNILLILLLVGVAMNLLVTHALAASQYRNETDRLSLLEFKNQISDDPYRVLNSWNHSLHHCEWQGVTCDTRHRRVTALRLRGNRLSGTISPHIGNLSFIKFIQLGENQLHGEIPQEIGHLFRLRLLILANNSLGGEIPVNLSYCSETRNIDLSRNKLEGTFPSHLTNLKKLEILYLGMNNLTGEISPLLGNLSSLTELSLDFNNLEGTLPLEMGFLRSFTKLGVASNKLSGMFPEFICNISTILVISMASNSFFGNLPNNIGLTLPNLLYFGIGANRFYGKLPISITNASNLEVFEPAYNNFEGQVPTNLGDLSNLRRLNLEGNLFGNRSTKDLAFIASLTNCSNLSIVSLSLNNFGGELPKVMTNLSNQLNVILMGRNQLSGTIPEGFGNFANLYSFAVEWNYLTGVIPRDFGKFQSLQTVNLNRNRLSGEILSTICNITTLYRLKLKDNLFEGHNIFGNVLMNSKNLQELDISQNKFSGDISPNFFGAHSSLIHLQLGQNRFGGSIPLEVGKLIHLVELNISYNNFSGEIPKSLGDCLNLETLYMQANFFQGAIPQNLASLKSIQQIDLSSNHLTGQISRELEKLQFLRYLNLSYNDLEGEIPNTGIFGNASQISVIGNNKVCGGIPDLDLPSCPVITRKNKRKLKVIILLSIVLPATILVLGILSFYFVVYQGRGRKQAVSSVPTTTDMVLRLSYHELYRATSGFSSENLVGSGGFGVVYKGILDQHGNKLIAVKVLDLQKHGASKSFKAECRTLRNIRHRNLVSIISYCSSINSNGHEFKALVYEFMENGNLDVWLHQETTDQAIISLYLNLLQRLNIAIDVASALQYLHNHCETTVVHCDLKPSNILLNKDLVAHVGDFGLARLLPKTVSTFSEHGTSSTIGMKGSIGYTAPEYGMGLPASTQGDVYSYGILLLEMITRRRPTDDMFIGDLDLYNYVNMAVPEKVYELVDPLLLSKEGDENREMASGEEIIYGGREMECIISLLKIGLKCSTRIPNDRMHMNEVLKELHRIKVVCLDA